MKKILFCFQQVGGANALLPLLEQWQGVHEIMITGRALVCENLAKRGFTVQPYDSHSSVSDAVDLAPFIEFNPDLLITDTISFTRVPEGIKVREFWRMARELGVPSLAYMDCWWGYEPRFKLPSESEIPLLPDCIGVVDQHAYDDFLNLGFDARNIAVLGCPRFQRLWEAGLANDPAVHQERKAALGVDREDFLLLFVSQPLEKTFGSEKEYGFTEKSTLGALLPIVQSVQQNLGVRVSVMVLLHPEEDETELKNVVRQLDCGVRIRFLREDDPIPSLLAADLVCGMFSIMLAEAAIMQRPVLSVQLNLRREEILITNRLGTTLSVRDEEALAAELARIVGQADYRHQLVANQQLFPVVTDSIRRWNRAVEGLLHGISLPGHVS